MGDTTYILGHSNEELQRLEIQARVLEPLTLRALQESGLREGMSVLDIGTGAGDVALLAAGIVGPTGRVHGIDRTEAALGRARARAAAAGLSWLRFDIADFGPGVALGSYDLVVGRFVLMHQPDPVAVLRQAASHVREGGALAFVEMAQTWDSRYSVPPVAAFDEAMTALLSAFIKAGANLDLGSRLTAVFAQAGLPEPALMSEVPVGGSSSVLPEWLSRTLHSVRPPHEHGIAWESLRDAICDAAQSSRSQLFGPRSVAAWLRR